MTKEKLKQLRILTREIELSRNILRDIQFFYERPYPLAKNNDSGTLKEYRAKIEKFSTKIEENIGSLIEQQGQIIQYIQEIPDSEIRQIFTLRYRYGLTWKKVATRLGISGDGSTERKKHDRYLLNENK